MDLQQLEADIIQMQERYEEWRRPISAVYKETEKLRDQGFYTKADQEHDMEVIYRQQLEIYNPALGEYPVQEALLAAYVSGNEEERTCIRIMVAKHDRVTNLMLLYILKCAECLETPADGWILRSGLVAAAIENFYPDFRDTGYVLAELAIAAFQAGIDIEPHALAVVEMCAPEHPDYMSMRKTIRNFHIYAPTAKHVFEE